MKKLIFFIFSLVIFITACGGISQDETNNQPTIDQEDSMEGTNGSSNITEENENGEEGNGEATVQEKETVNEGENQEEDSKETSNLFEVPLLYVIDGDTIKVKINGQEESVRFLLVDTPETSHPRLGKQPFGEEAKAFTKNLLSGSTVLLEKDVSERDKYGRLLMYVYTPDGKSVQEELLRKGLARVAYVYVPNTKYVDRYYEIQQTAQANAIGIWSVENYAQEDGYHSDVIEKEEDTQVNPNLDAFKPDANGNCGGYIKGNDSSSGDFIYHVPEGSYYNVTKAEMCFKTEEAAKEAGYRKSQR